MNIKLVELRSIAERIFTYLEETGRKEFNIDEDYYWEISKEEIYNPVSDPKNLTLGQLSDDWERLTAIMREEDPPIGHAFVWLSTILRNIGENSAY